MESIEKFIIESWKIEGIDLRGRELSKAIVWHGEFLDEPIDGLLDAIILAVQRFTGIKTPLRVKKGMNVRIGNHRPPEGSPEIEDKLISVLEILDPYEQHQAYEHLHPFMDGNGRTGRMLWLRTMLERREKIYDSSFLHTWYYKSLTNFRQ